MGLLFGDFGEVGESFGPFERCISDHGGVGVGREGAGELSERRAGGSNVLEGNGGEDGGVGDRGFSSNGGVGDGVVDEGFRFLFDGEDAAILEFELVDDCFVVDSVIGDSARL